MVVAFSHIFIEEWTFIEKTEDLNLRLDIFQTEKQFVSVYSCCNINTQKQQHKESIKKSTCDRKEIIQYKYRILQQ